MLAGAQVRKEDQATVAQQLHGLVHKPIPKPAGYTDADHAKLTELAALEAGKAFLNSPAMQRPANASFRKYAGMRAPDGPLWCRRDLACLTSRYFIEWYWGEPGSGREGRFPRYKWMTAFRWTFILRKDVVSKLVRTTTVRRAVGVQALAALVSLEMCTEQLH